jgi:DNA invertase Pin-like site-specific DNA recombinase
MRAAIYARVSTTDKGQDPELQLKPLREYCKARGWTIVEVFVDHCSGSKDTRPCLDQLIAQARKRLVDCIVV